MHVRYHVRRQDFCGSSWLGFSNYFVRWIYLFCCLACIGTVTSSQDAGEGQQWFYDYQTTPSPAGKPAGDTLTQLTTTSPHGSYNLTTTAATSSYTTTTETFTLWYENPENFRVSSIITKVVIAVPTSVVLVVIVIVGALRCNQCRKDAQLRAQNGNAGDWDTSDLENALNSSRIYASADARNAPPTYTDAALETLFSTQDETSPSASPAGSNCVDKTGGQEGLPSYQDVMSGAYQ